MHIFGIDWVGVNPQNGRRLLLSLAFVAVVLAASWVLRKLAGLLTGAGKGTPLQVKFWARQGISLLAAVVLILGLLSIWFSDPTRLATALGLVSAGLAFALQQVVTSIAGYFVILRGSTFTVGDRITMGGVRGDVIRLGFIQTTIMEMGQPPSVQGAEPAMWVRTRASSPAASSPFQQLQDLRRARVTTTPATSPSSGRRWPSPSRTPPTVRARRPSCWRPPDATRRRPAAWRWRRRPS